MDNITYDLDSVVIVSCIYRYWHDFNFEKLYDEVDISSYCVSNDDLELYKKVTFLYMFRKATDINNIYPMNSSFYNLFKLDPKDIFLNYISDGYFRASTLDEILMTYTVEQLKKLCKEHNIKSSRNKTHIVSSIMLSDLADLLYDNSDFDSYYSLSEKGINTLIKNDDIVKYIKSQNFNVTLEDFFRYRYCGNSIRNYNDTIFQVLSEKLYINQIHYKFSKMELIENEIAKLLISEGKYDIAKQHLLFSFFLHFTFVSTVNYIFNDIRFNPVSSFYFSLNFTQMILSVSNYINNDDFHNAYLLYINNNPPCFLTEDEMYLFFINIIETQTFDNLTYIDIINNRLYMLKNKINKLNNFNQNQEEANSYCDTQTENENTIFNDSNVYKYLNTIKNFIFYWIKKFFVCFFDIIREIIVNIKDYSIRKKFTPKSKSLSLILCIFTMCGHKFYEGKIVMGIIYILTGGLFGIGWIIDIISLIGKPNPYYV